jgi:hypothetical protein
MTRNTDKNYCPTTHANACACGGSSSWGSALREARKGIALLVLDAMGGVDWERQQYRCPLTDRYVPFTQGGEVDRPESGACYRFGNMVLTSATGNRARAAYGDPDAEWSARYAACVARASASVAERIDAMTQSDLRALGRMVTVSEQSSQPVTTGQFWDK